ncbi:protein O-D-mannosyltransferase [Martensiomyces pterosporus]|nr:protein O-D-mannosyltransferase [Martensiomyces pterosporus]
MRYRKQPGAAAVYDDATVISGMSSTAGTPVAPDHGLLSISRNQWITLGFIVLAAAYIRLWRLSNPANVVFDEVHFGKFAGKYINGTYFFDVHPPLAKMMFAAAGKLAGYDGVFDFKSIGLDYVAAGVPYVGMRFMPAILGLSMVPITYITLAALGHAADACALGALVVAFENALLTQSRLILLDASLIFFTGLTIMFWALFFTEAQRPFSNRWWAYLLLTGVNLGNALSCKWVGLFLVATVGVWTLKDLWEKLGDLSITPAQYTKHFVARAVALIAVPLTVYLFWFQIHFTVLHKSGDGNAFMSPEFQNTLDGVTLGHTPRDIYYGARVRIRHDASNAGYLHSHLSNYETGSKQQQITLYGFRDDNNFWTITRTDADEEKFQNSSDPSALQQIKDGDIVRLMHWKTHRRLHSHDERPPVTTHDYQNEVSGYGWEGFNGDSNDHWRVQILDGDSSVPESKTKLMAIYSKFRLVHVNQRCALFSNRKKLPKWAHEQVEVSCMKSAKFPKTLWRIETNINDHTPQNAPLAEYRRPGLVAKVLEATRVMWRVNNGLTKSHPYESRPHTWPWMRRGMAFWGDGDRSIYLIGTPILWWLSFVAIVSFAAIQVALFFRDRRGFHDRLLGARERYFESVGFLSVGWLLHWIPFFLMGRQLFLHHYLPALWLAILALVGTVDLFTRRVSRKVRQALMGVLLLAVVRIHVAYGTSWTRQGCERSKWFKSWDYDCKRYVDLSVKPSPSLPVVPVPTAATHDAAAPNAAHADEGAAKDHADPPPAQNFDPLEHENKLNEPAPRIDHDKLNSNAERLDREMKKAATTAEAKKDTVVVDEANKDENIVGEEGVQQPPTAAPGPVITPSAIPPLV